MSLLQYKGVTISLISRSDIRYIGVLDDINQETSSIALVNVKSCGTEGRKNSPYEEIPANDNVFPYICFRASDVKDLVVEQEMQASQPPPLATLHDPAIIDYATQSMRAQTSPQQGPTNQFPANYSGGSQQISPNSGTPSMSERRSNGVDGASSGTGLTRPRSGQMSQSGFGNNAGHERTGSSNYGPYSSNGTPRGGDHAFRRHSPSRFRESHHRDVNYASNHDSRFRSQRYSGGAPFSASSNRGGYRSRRYPNSSEDNVIPKEEFDFETANAKFHKDDLYKEYAVTSQPGVVANDVPAKCYDRKASFFDNISCDSKERVEKDRKGGPMGGAHGFNPSQEPRKGRGERKLNIQTFGSSTVDQLFQSSNHHNYHGPSHYNFRGHHGSGHRGGRGQYHNNYYNRRSQDGPSDYQPHSDYRHSQKAHS